MPMCAVFWKSGKWTNMSDPTPVVLAVLAGLVIAAFSIFCIAKPDRLAAYARRRYLRSSKFTQGLPFASMVTKEWYPTYLRLMGAFGLLFVIGWCYAVVAQLRGQ